MTEPPASPAERVRRLSPQPPARRTPYLRIYQPSRHQLRLDFSGDVDQWSRPLLAAALNAAEAAPRADILIDLGDTTALYDVTLKTFSDIRTHAELHSRSLTFIRLSEAALRTFDLRKFAY
ncbi:hypothetical protein [Cryptosporangium sp. NPDC048952]|uniref:hypothetical protein n=1 Tax=Cryptosporangium sp. NPDC048952 TaxID=3363961 RepID=UPI00371B82BE